MDIRVPNGCKPSVCFHNGFWMMHQFFPQHVTDESNSDFLASTNEFCKNYSEELSQRYLFVNDMMHFANNESEFMAKC